jgi:hypothetical protein
MSDKYTIFHIDGGVGKNIVATAVAKSIKTAYPEHKLIVVTAYPEVYLNNPNIYRVYKFGNLPYFYDNYINGKDSIILRMEPYHSGDLLYKRKSLAEVWCDVFKIPCVSKVPEIFLTQREMIYTNQVMNKQGPILLIQAFGGAENQNFPYSWSRDLPPLFAQNLIDTLKPKFDKIYLIGRQNQPELKNTVKITDHLRNLFCYIYQADKILGIDSFVQHAAAALSKKATVGWISNSPVVFGHEIHTNITPKNVESFRHKIDSYLEKDDWGGSRFYECPYDDINSIFDINQFEESILGSKNELVFDMNLKPNDIL